jgi:hypothetical protein
MEGCGVVANTEGTIDLAFNSASDYSTFQSLVHFRPHHGMLETAARGGLSDHPATPSSEPASAEDMMAWITADPLIQQLTASGFVVMKGQPAAAPLPSHHPAHRGLRTRFNGQKHSALAGLKRADNWGKVPCIIRDGMAVLSIISYGNCTHRKHWATKNYRLLIKDGPVFGYSHCHHRARCTASLTDAFQKHFRQNSSEPRAVPFLAFDRNITTVEPQHCGDQK